VSKEIKKIDPNANIEGNKNNPRTGSFEIMINGNLVYSKFKTHSFPSKIEIEELMK
jgi:selT/selW/selH-like putative selenoprotein